MTENSRFERGRPVVLRGGTVLPMDDARTVLPETDVLVVDDRVVEIGRDLAVPDGATVIDATDGIVMPGMIDTHRHMWQTAMRGYGADWTLTQYFVWYYMEGGKLFRPEDVHAGNALAAAEALEAGVTTVVDWSHGLQTVDHADAAADALESVPGRYVLAYGNIQAQPGEWATDPAFRDFVRRRFDGNRDMLDIQIAFDVTGDPAFPEKPAFEAARELGLPVTTHAGVWGATGDDSIRLMHEHGFMTPETVYVHAASLSTDSYHRIAATGGSASVSTESEQSAGQGYPPTWKLREHGIPVSLSMDTSAWWSGDLFSAMRSTLGADRSREHLRRSRAVRPSPTRPCARTRSWSGRPAAAPARWAAATTWAGSAPAPRPTWSSSRTTTPRSPSRCSTPTATWPSRPSAATCTRSWSTGVWSSTSTAWSTSTWPRSAGTWRRPSTTCAVSSARRNGPRA